MSSKEITGEPTKVLRFIDGTCEAHYYCLPAEQALIAAHEQHDKNNYSTWDYGKPDRYPIHTSERGGKILGNCWVKV